MRLHVASVSYAGTSIHALALAGMQHLVRTHIEHPLLGSVALSCRPIIEIPSLLATENGAYDVPGKLRLPGSICLQCQMRRLHKLTVCIQNCMRLGRLPAGQGIVMVFEVLACGRTLNTPSTPVVQAWMKVADVDLVTPGNDRTRDHEPGAQQIGKCDEQSEGVPLGGSHHITPSTGFSGLAYRWNGEGGGANITLRQHDGMDCTRSGIGVPYLYVCTCQSKWRPTLIV